MYQIWFILTAYVIRQPNIATAELRTQIQLASTAQILKYTLFVLSAKVWDNEGMWPWFPYGEPYLNNMRTFWVNFHWLSWTSSTFLVYINSTFTGHTAQSPTSPLTLNITYQSVITASIGHYWQCAYSHLACATWHDLCLCWHPQTQFLTLQLTRLQTQITWIMCQRSTAPC